MSYNESRKSDSNYPPMSQSQWDNAPFNQEDNDPKTITVTVSLTISKTMNIEVDDYRNIVDEDEDGKYAYTDFSDCDLESAVKDQVTLPHEVGNKLKTVIPQYILDDITGWNVDDLEVIKE